MKQMFHLLQDLSKEITNIYFTARFFKREREIVD